MGILVIQSLGSLHEKCMKPTDKPSVKFQQLNQKQRVEVLKKVNYGQETPEYKRRGRAEKAYEKAIASTLQELNQEPLTTGALFVVTGAVLDFATNLLSQIGRMQSGEQSYFGEELGDATNGFGPEDVIGQKWLEELIKRYAGRDSVVDNAYWEKDEAEFEERHAEEELFDKTANEMFGQQSSEACRGA